jgi:hypothetical protein
MLRQALALAAIMALGCLGPEGEAAAAPIWTATYMPQPPESGNGHSAFDVSCVDSDACVAVGENWSLAVHTRVPLAERWDGTTWTPMEAPYPAGLDEGWKHEWYALLRGVSCVAPDSCLAVGRYRSSEGESVQPLAERWDGSEWTMMTPPLPPGAISGRLESVSCTSSTECTAVGFFRGALGVDETLAIGWDGSQWTLEPASNPPGSPHSWLFGVSCSSGPTCTAVGASELEGGHEATLAERWDGSEWAIQATPNPGDREVARLYDVSCPSSSACTAVGYSQHGSTIVSLAERWSGSEWAAQETPTPEEQGNLHSVSCVSPTACTAVGSYYVAPEPGHGWQPLVERWSGSTWSPLEVAGLAVPAGWWHESPLSAVSCPQTEDCTAVGGALSAPPEGLAAERAFGEHEGVLPTPPVPAAGSGTVPPAVEFGIGKVRTACHGRLVLSLRAEGAGDLTAEAVARSSLRAGKRRGAKRLASCNAGRIGTRAHGRRWSRPFGYGNGSATASAAGPVKLTIVPSRPALRAIRRPGQLQIELKVTFRSSQGQSDSRATSLLIARP